MCIFYIVPLPESQLEEKVNKVTPKIKLEHTNDNIPLNKRKLP